MSVGKNYCSFFVQFTDKLFYEARAITPNTMIDETTVQLAA